MSDQNPERDIRRLSRRGLLWGAIAVAFGYESVHFLDGAHQEEGLQWPFRRVQRLNEKLSEAYFSNRSLAREFPMSEAKMPKVNEDIGMEDQLDLDAWRLNIIGAAAGEMMLTLAELQALPNVEMVTELRCIEGWSCIVHWTGCRLRDVVEKYPPRAPGVNVDKLETLPPYLGLETPNGQYYVGLDMASALHPQTLLCWAMMGQPLTRDHGAPLRLVIPVKYGIKNIKRIGKLIYAGSRPRDYWAENDEGYDWYAGL
jgi:DMSO/TMAO reductase YedYZ molybdopterin-dependent catalytic subunit